MYAVTWTTLDHTGAPTSTTHAEQGLLDALVELFATSHGDHPLSTDVDLTDAVYLHGQATDPTGTVIAHHWHRVNDDYTLTQITDDELLDELIDPQLIDETIDALTQRQ